MEKLDNPFEKVLDRLRERGWVKDTWGEPEGPNCINGAADYADIPDCINFQEATSLIAMEQFPDRVNRVNMTGSGMSYWMAGLYFNNHPDTTFEDVERVLEKAAIKWEEDQING